VFEKGATPAEIGVIAVELIVVFTKLSAEPPLSKTRFNTPLFGAGAFKNIVRSPSQVCVILKFTLALVPTAVAGIPATTNDVLTPVGSESGIPTAIGPEFTVVVPAVGAPIIVNKVGSPAQRGVLGLAVIVIGATGVAETVIVGVPLLPVPTQVQLFSAVTDTKL